MIPQTIFARTLFIILFCSFFLVSEYLRAQGSAGSESTIEPRYLIDLPTAGIIPHGNLALDMEFYQEDGVLSTLSIGAFNRLVFGVSFGGSHIIGTEKPAWNSTPGFAARLRLIEETIVLPAIAVGFDSQGKGAYIDQLSRYTIKSLGFYAVASKNYKVMGFLSLHGGVNYSLERADGNESPNFFAGIEKTLGPFISCFGEYDLGSNDNNGDALGRGRGYANLGFRISVGKGFSLGMNLKDIIQNQQEISIGNRTLMLEYVQAM
ncbi:MAG TPA: hypothetical protein VKI62_05270 [Bacteroidota bacterium]|nr:hypothetical protein [Bacteroidota bacterium]